MGVYREQFTSRQALLGDVSPTKLASTLGNPKISDELDNALRWSSVYRTVNGKKHTANAYEAGTQ